MPEQAYSITKDKATKDKITAMRDVADDDDLLHSGRNDCESAPVMRWGPGYRTTPIDDGRVTSP